MQAEVLLSPHSLLTQELRHQRQCDNRKNCGNKGIFRCSLLIIAIKIGKGRQRRRRRCPHQHHQYAQCHAAHEGSADELRNDGHNNQRKEAENINLFILEDFAHIRRRQQRPNVNHGKADSCICGILQHIKNRLRQRNRVHKAEYADNRGKAD